MAEDNGGDALLRDLVNGHLETPDVEYKNWLDLTDDLVRANTARHICALANLGGGHLVFGFDDDGATSSPPPPDLAGYGQDAINGVVDRYLVPPMHCAVHMVTAASGQTHPVVRVPSHGAQPVCAKRDGPQIKGRVEGIRRGAHYIRVSGPKSHPIDHPEMWRDVIRRCIVAERDELLGSISRLFDRPTTPEQTSDLPPFVNDALAEWALIEAVAWPVNTEANRVAFGFRLLTADNRSPVPLDIATLRDAVRSAGLGASDEVNDGLVPFELGWSEQQRPRVALFGDMDGLEMRRTALEEDVMPALWRVAVDGVGIDVSIFAEDLPHLRAAIERNNTRQWPPGGRMSPRFHIQHVAQRIAFVRRLAEQFEADACEVMVDYAGLRGRVIDELAPTYYSRQYTASEAGRRVAVAVPVSNLGAEAASITATLLQPIFRLFDGWDVNAEYVAAELARPR
ncbi:ATP-binding protein [Sphingomonas sp.]|jgi:hypothetical protein|uniref:AlbA family DNA-binding domain-containing protein n=1 Tax=Sphingomonas sp. TaxID=28214 RepID=UPI002E30D244|nr:ATP-binding protein [Sphingomonas sp.]HEX4694480.1 ATP-binding protein [Sphingomonas sp.]